ncbi:hypothetical protein [Gemmiger formicilis]|uniref:hypothetical protein n=1 Tax=Gemmiger formicilis TaxID=745368 RepID=UPI003CCAF8CC
MAAAFVIIIHLWEVCYNRQQLKSNELEINEQIRDKEIRLIRGRWRADGHYGEPARHNEDGYRQGRRPRRKVGAAGKPPVCKILDYGKWVRDTEKEKKPRRTRKWLNSREIRLS